MSDEEKKQVDFNTRMIRAMAEAERMMDEGKIQFVMAPSPNGIQERMALPPAVMEHFGLKSGQNINSMIRDAILKYLLSDVLKGLKEFLETEVSEEEEEIEEQLKDDFDFRNMLGDGDEPTKH